MVYSPFFNNNLSTIIAQKRRTVYNWSPDRQNHYLIIIYPFISMCQRYVEKMDENLDTRMRRQLQDSI